MQIRTEELSNGELLSICNLIEIAELIPFQHSLYNIRTFDDFARFCILPFIYFYSPSCNDETSQSEVNYEPHITHLNVELRQRSFSLLQLKDYTFLKQKCLLRVYHVFDQTIRVVFVTTEQNCDFNLFLDFEYSASLWAGLKQFKHADFKIDGQAVPI